jgi:Holliday junction resolvase RusA-like endonuclease
VAAKTTTSSQVGRVQFFIPRDPFPGQRTNCTCRGRFATVYTPAAYRDWKDDAKDYIAGLAPQFTGIDREAEVTLSAEFVATPPKTTKLRRPKPDIDNFLKSLMDAITQSEVLWKDDSQVAELGRVRKRWATPGEPPGIYVTLQFEVQ